MATDRIARLQTQRFFCYQVLLTYMLKPTCPPERAAITCLNLARPTRYLQAYRPEFRFYLAEAKHRRRANGY